MHRKLLTPAFHFKMLESFVPTMNEHAQVMINEIAASSKNIVDIRPLITNCTLNTICETSMGVKLDGSQKFTDAYVRPLNHAMELIMERIVEPMYQSDFIYHFTAHKKQFDASMKQVHAFVQKVSPLTH